MSTSKKANQDPNQIGILEEMLGKLSRSDDSVTSDELEQMIERLTRLKAEAKKREKEELARHRERERERLAKEIRQREEEEKQRLEDERRREEERLEAITAMDLPLDWENAFATDERAQGVHAESIPDALILSLSTLGRVDIEYMSAITGEDCKHVILALKGSIYQNPDTWEECFYRGWETAEEYLSGNLMRKWESAQEANEAYRGYFKDNLDALGRLLPETVRAKDIYVTLGSPWVPADVIDEFITHILNLKKNPYYGTIHDEYTGTWEIPQKSNHRYRCSVAATHKYGTKRIEALTILERTLNMKAVSVTDEIACSTNASGTKRVINQAETVLAIERQQKMIEEFQKWIWKDESRRERLEMIFENNFGCVRRRIFDGSFLTFPTLSPAISLYPYQKNAVARILFSPNTLLAHDVGSGKTYIMIAAGMELRRMGLSKKNLYVVPNNIVGQWHEIFKTMYPHAKLLCVEPKGFTPERREHMLETVRDGDFDAIIMAYSCFERIPLSKKFQMEELEQKKETLHRIAQDRTRATSGVQKKREAIERALSELCTAIEDSYNTVYFDELGITRLFVDEAHNYKNLPIETKADKVLGISSSGSKKCRDMMDKVHQIQKQNNGGGVVMATGTPITNSITDAYVMQLYLQSGELAMLDLHSFDGWIGMFAERVTEFEIDVDTNSYRLATRFAKFHNLPELTSLLASIADFHQVDPSADIPEHDGYHDALLSRTDALSSYLQDISSRAECVRAGQIDRREDNMLKITTDGRKAALDLRLVDPSAGFTYQSKVARCAENVFDIYSKTAPQQSAQLIFCDSSTPKSEFNVYDELKRLLVGMGMPPEQIAFIHDAATEPQRAKLFGKVRRGEVRVLVGSTFKLGLGVNVQDRLIALHHLDVPWRPADMTQREGRILRQGNQNKKVFLYRYITEGSFDAYSWQLLETKQRFIAGLLSGSLTARSGSDIEGTVLNYAEVKALAIGNPLIKQRVETANELSRLLALQRQTVETHIRLEREATELPAQITHQRELIEHCKEDLERYLATQRDYDKEERRRLRSELYQAVRTNLLVPQETPCMTYQGFSVLLPAGMTAEKPYVWLVGRGRYYVELGDTELGALVRLDNYLDKLDEHLQKLKAGLAELLERQEAIAQELSRREDYADRIEETRLKLERMDKKLGVNKK